MVAFYGIINPKTLWRGFQQMPNEKYLETIKKFRLIDDTFFSVCFDSNEEDVEYILRIILDKPSLKVLKVQTQKSVENMYGRSVRFDVFATDDNDKLYNIEVQRADSGAVPARARFNSVMLDYHRLKKKAKFNELPETFVIFITEHDVLKGGEQIYHVDRVVRETNKSFGDGTHIIYVNGSYKDDSDSALGNLIHDFFCSDASEMKHNQLAERVSFLKGNKREVRKMCKLMEELQNEAREEAKKETLLDNIRNLMQKLNMTAQQAMEILEVPADKQKEYVVLI